MAVRTVATHVKRLFPTPSRALGALTSKPYAFKTRSWELKSTESIDIFDATGSNIRIDTRGTEIMRILPRLNEHVNEEWISDKARFSYDGLKRQRLTTPLIRGLDDNFIPVSWERVRAYLRNKILQLSHDFGHGFECHAVLGGTVDVHAALRMRNEFYRTFPHGQIHLQERYNGITTDFRHSYVCNTKLEDLERADVALLIGADPRREAPLMNARLRKAALYNGLQVGIVGCHSDLTYEAQHLGTSTRTLSRIANGEHEFANLLKMAERPVVIVSNAALRRADGAHIMKLAEHVVEECGVVKKNEQGHVHWDGFCVLHNGANTVGNLDIGFDDKYAGLRGADAGTWDATKLLYLMNVDDISNINVGKDCIVVYQGHHGDKGAQLANVILPGAAYTEREGRYVNMEGRVQESKLAFFPPGLAMDDADLLRDIHGANEKHERDMKVMDVGLEVLAPHLLRGGVQRTDRVVNGEGKRVYDEDDGNGGCLQLPVDNFYMTDVVTRCSTTMAKCSRVRDRRNFI